MIVKIVRFLMVISIILVTFLGSCIIDNGGNGTGVVIEEIDFPVNTVLADNNSVNWAGGTEGLQVHCGHDLKAQLSFIYFSEDLPDKYMYAINQAPNGNIWVGT